MGDKNYSSDEEGDEEVKKERAPKTELNTNSLVHYLKYISNLPRSEMYPIMDKKKKTKQMEQDLEALSLAGHKCSSRFWLKFFKQTIATAEQFKKDEGNFCLNLKNHFGMGEIKVVNMSVEELQVSTDKFILR